MYPFVVKYLTIILESVSGEFIGLVFNTQIMTSSLQVRRYCHRHHHPFSISFTKKLLVAWAVAQVAGRIQKSFKRERIITLRFYKITIYNSKSCKNYTLSVCTPIVAE